MKISRNSLIACLFFFCLGLVISTFPELPKAHALDTFTTENLQTLGSNYSRALSAKNSAVLTGLLKPGYAAKLRPYLAGSKTGQCRFLARSVKVFDGRLACFYVEWTYDGLTSAECITVKASGRSLKISCGPVPK